MTLDKLMYQENTDKCCIDQTNRSNSYKLHIKVLILISYGTVNFVKSFHRYKYKQIKLITLFTIN